MTDKRTFRREKRQAERRRRGKTAPSRVRQSTKALAMFWLTPTTQAEPSWPPFCPLDPTEADLARSDALSNFARWLVRT